jgi:hypothetical protein
VIRGRELGCALLSGLPDQLYPAKRNFRVALTDLRTLVVKGLKNSSTPSFCLEPTRCVFRRKRDRDRQRRDRLTYANVYAYWYANGCEGSATKPRLRNPTNTPPIGTKPENGPKEPICRGESPNRVPKHRRNINGRRSSSDLFGPKTIPR